MKSLWHFNKYHKISIAGSSWGLTIQLKSFRDSGEHARPVSIGSKRLRKVERYQTSAVQAQDGSLASWPMVRFKNLTFITLQIRQKPVIIWVLISYNYNASDDMGIWILPPSERMTWAAHHDPDIFNFSKVNLATGGKDLVSCLPILYPNCEFCLIGLQVHRGLTWINRPKWGLQWVCVGSLYFTVSKPWHTSAHIFRSKTSGMAGSLCPSWANRKFRLKFRPIPICGWRS